jgi:hypothetical protein
MLRIKIYKTRFARDRLCGLVVKVSEFLATDPEVRVRFPAQPDFLRGSGSGTGFTQPHNSIEELLGRNNDGSGLEAENTAVGFCCSDHATPSICKSWH